MGHPVTLKTMPIIIIIDVLFSFRDYACTFDVKQE